MSHNTKVPVLKILLLSTTYKQINKVLKFLIEKFIVEKISDLGCKDKKTL